MPLQTAFWLACDALILRHCAPWELDEALTDWGYGLGPCEAQDIVGLEQVLAARAGKAETPVLPRMLNEGRMGRAAGWGYYRYPGGGGAVVDPLIDDLVREEAHFAKIERHELDGAALVAALHAQVGDMIRAAGADAGRLLHFPVVRMGAL